MGGVPIVGRSVAPSVAPVTRIEIVIALPACRWVVARVDAASGPSRFNDASRADGGRFRAGEGPAAGAAVPATPAPGTEDASLLGLGEARQRAVKAALVERGVSASPTRTTSKLMP